MEQVNITGLCGTVAEAPKRYHNVYGQSNVYALWLDTQRDSGTVDRVLVLLQENKIDGDSFQAPPGDYFDAGTLAALITPCSSIEVSGQIQTYKDKATGSTQLFVWASYLAAAQEDKGQLNAVYITGEIAKQPVHRETPLGRHITDIALRVPSAFTKGFYSYIPCITWGRMADYAAELQEGAVVYLEGRLQSREYTKHTEEGDQVLTTWEVSAYKLRVED